MSHAAVQRRAVRRAARTRCQAVDSAGFALLGEQVVDLSPRGMLILCTRRARVGDGVLVSFRAPSRAGQAELWFDAEAIVARVVAGRRRCDEGYGAGLEFTYFEKSCRHELLMRLAGFPLPVPRFRERSWVASGPHAGGGVHGFGKSLSIPKGAFGWH